jgi:hypothetical protein
LGSAGFRKEGYIIWYIVSEIFVFSMRRIYEPQLHTTTFTKQFCSDKIVLTPSAVSMDMLPNYLPAAERINSFQVTRRDRLK